MQEYQSGAVRDTGGKGRMDLLPMCALIRVSKHMEDAIRPDPETGKAHYEERNWEMGIPLHTMIDSALRHMAKYMDGWNDEDHLCAAATNLLMAMWTEEKKPEMQDIPTRFEVASDNGTCRVLEPKSSGAIYHNQLCPYYDPNNKTCGGTKEHDLVSCNGITTKCDR